MAEKEKSELGQRSLTSWLAVGEKQAGEKWYDRLSEGKEVTVKIESAFTRRHLLACANSRSIDMLHLDFEPIFSFDPFLFVSSKETSLF